MATPLIAVPLATAPASIRFNASTRPEFIYTNPTAAAQAASNLQARLGYESAEDQGYRDYLSRINESQQATRRADLQAQSYSDQLRAAMQEGAANRASAERIAGASAAERQYRVDLAQWEDNERAAEVGEQTAAMLNADPNAKVDRKWAWQNPETGRWESRFQRRARPAPPMFGAPGVAAPVQRTSDIGPAPAIPAAPQVGGYNVGVPAPSFDSRLNDMDAQIERSLRAIFDPLGQSVIVPDPGPAPMRLPPEPPRNDILQWYPGPELPTQPRSQRMVPWSVPRPSPLPDIPPGMFPPIMVPDPGPAPMRDVYVGERYPAPVGVPFY